jgi:hypothetical protein
MEALDVSTIVKRKGAQSLRFARGFEGSQIPIFNLFVRPNLRFWVCLETVFRSVRTQSAEL